MEGWNELRGSLRKRKGGQGGSMYVCTTLNIVFFFFLSCSFLQYFNQHLMAQLKIHHSDPGTGGKGWRGSLPSSFHPKPCSRPWRGQ